jgi:steroid delta-isomerase-like uncharacterized protein
MSEQDQIDLVRRSLEAWSQPAKRAEYFDLYSSDAILHGYPGVEPGLDNIKRFYEAFWIAFPDAVATVEAAFADGDKVACRVLVRATNQKAFQGIPASGKSVSLPAITILRFQNGRCVERWTQADFLGLMQQLQG